MRPLQAAPAAESDRILRDLQAVMFAYDVGILKSAERLQRALREVEALDQQFQDLAAPHTHELVRLKETEAMLLAARFILGASLLPHRIAAEPFPRRPSAARRRKLAGVDRCLARRRPARVRSKTPIPTPLCPVLTRPVRPTRLNQRLAVAGN